MMVSGDVSDFSDSSCQLELLSANSSKKILHSFDVSGKFNQDFTISPNKNDYIVTIICNEKNIFTKRITYPNDIGVGGVLNVGILKT